MGRTCMTPTAFPSRPGLAYAAVSMAALSTLTVAWAFVYGYVAIYYGMLWAFRRADREYFYFALLLAFLGAHSLADAAVLAPVPGEGARASLQVALIAAMAMNAYFVEFCHALAERPVPARRFLYALVAVGIALVGMGLYTRPAPSTGTGPLVPGVLELTWAGRVQMTAMILISVWGLVRAWPAGRRERELRVLTLALAASLAAAAHDGLVQLGLVRSVYLLEHTSLLSVGAMSWALLGRFVRVEEELERKTTALETSTRDLRATQELLVTKEQLAAVGELSAVIAHEVRNPLAVIKNAVSGLRRKTLGREDRGTLLEIVGEETERLNRLMHDLLAYARPVTPKSEAVGVVALVQRALDSARQGSEQAELVQIVLDVEEAPAELAGDAGLLRHALVNVIDNAILAMPDGGTLTVSIKPARIEERAAVSLSFHDQGEGMDTLVRDKATRPFFTTRPAGTGLGLAIVERVVRNHGGRIDIESSHGAGTNVTIRLPLTRPSLLPPARGERRVSDLSAIKAFGP